MANLGFDRLMNSGTFILDSTTVGKLKGDLDSAVNKAVALVGNYTVGYGADANAIFGIISKVEYEDNTKKVVLATVQMNGTFENIDAQTTVTAGDGLAVDGNGGVKTASTGVINATVIGYDTEAKKATIAVKTC